MKVLSIGNSFSEDAHRWLHDIAISDRFSLDCANIFVHDKQTLEYQWHGMKMHTADNVYQVNGMPYFENVIIDDILKLQEWDAVTLQQVSNKSGRPQSYYPYIQHIARRVKELAPNAKIYIHQTWSFENGTQSEAFLQYNRNCGEMYRRVKDAVETAARLLEARIIPVGDVIQHLREDNAEFNACTGGQGLCLDGRHLSHIYGRYAAGAVWYETLTGRDVRQADFVPACDAERGDSTLLQIIRDKTHEIYTVNT